MNDKRQSRDASTALTAILQAQKLALAPMLFQAARLLRDYGILDELRTGRTGLGADEIAGRVGLSAYGTLVLLEAGLAAEVVRREEDRYHLTPTGFCLLTDEATRINMDVVQQCCYQPAYFLEHSIQSGEPIGLHEVFGDWQTIYPALPGFPEKARESWLAWDHYYSDAAFPQALPLVFQRRPRNLLDVGGNTGKWAIRCARHCETISVTILDLPEVTALAEENIREHGLQDRISTIGMNLLRRSEPFPQGFDAIWMSQFLVCFSEDEVQSLLERAAAAMHPESKLYILDNFWDRQSNEIASFCLQTFSLYFTFLANGRSRMYKASDIARLAGNAGLKVENIHDNLGVCTSLVTCSKS